jgi:hypothetical protein
MVASTPIGKQGGFFPMLETQWRSTMMREEGLIGGVDGDAKNVVLRVQSAGN